MRDKKREITGTTMTNTKKTTLLGPLHFFDFFLLRLKLIVTLSAMARVQANNNRANTMECFFFVSRFTSGEEFEITLQKMLIYDPGNRINARDALQHHYFKDLKKKYSRNFTSRNKILNIKKKKVYIVKFKISVKNNVIYKL